MPIRNSGQVIYRHVFILRNMDVHDQRIIEFVAENRGCNKEDVVNGTGDLSRVPTINRLNNLIYLVIIITRAKGKKFRNKLYVSEHDLISSVSKQMSMF